jgi:hypothetical protein
MMTPAHTSITSDIPLNPSQTRRLVESRREMLTTTLSDRGTLFGGVGALAVFSMSQLP